MPQDVDFFFDFVSPYTYLAQTQFAALQERTGARFRLWPMHLLNLMKQVGNVPTTVICANKLKYAGQDIGRWVARYGVPFQMNPTYSRRIRVSPSEERSWLRSRTRRTCTPERSSVPSGVRALT